MRLWPAPLVMLALAGAAWGAEPLEDATYEAIKLCGRIGQQSIDDCSRSVGRSPEHSAARKAVIRMFNARTAFMNNCFSTDRYPADCPHIAEWHFWRAFNRAVNEEQTATAIK